MLVKAKSQFRAMSWWLRLWGLNMVSLMAGGFFLPFRWWVMWAIVGFGSMEGVGLYSQRIDNRLPPLTDVIRTYVPRWACLAAMWSLLAAAASVWGITWRSPWEVALLFGVSAWLTDHFIHRYDEPASD